MIHIANFYSVKFYQGCGKQLSVISLINENYEELLKSSQLDKERIPLKNSDVLSFWLDLGKWVRPKNLSAPIAPTTG